MSVGGKRVRRRLSPHQECALRLARECLVLERVSDPLDNDLRFAAYCGMYLWRRGARITVVCELQDFSCLDNEVMVSCPRHRLPLGWIQMKS